MSAFTNTNRSSWHGYSARPYYAKRQDWNGNTTFSEWMSGGGSTWFNNGSSAYRRTVFDNGAYVQSAAIYQHNDVGAC